VSFWEFFLLLAIFIPMVMLWIFTLTDLARRADISGVAKGLWAVAVVILPLVGMLVYFIARPTEPEMQPDPEVRMREITEGADTSSMIDQLEKIAELHESGILSDQEFASAKAKLLDTA
jgi:hypothetical protein